MSHLSSEQIDEVSSFVANYISSQRNHFAPHGSTLTSAQQTAMAGFFSPDLLRTTRILVIEPRRIENPDFYPSLRTLGVANLPDFGQMLAVAFQDVIVSHYPFSNGLVFHELVHVEQYRLLGVPLFAALYVRGFLAGGGYEGIPLEINAYTLGKRFELAPDQPFSVEAEVSLWKTQGRFWDFARGSPRHSNAPSGWL